MRNPILIILIFIPAFLFSQADQVKLTAEQASQFALAGLNCIQSSDQEKSGKPLNEFTPGSYGCMDWNTSAHSYWMLVKLLKEYPGLPEEKEIREVINQNLISEVQEARLAQLLSDEDIDFEKSNGWAWQLKLSAELYDWDDSDGKLWNESLQLLTDKIIEKYIKYLTKVNQANRTGDQTNTAFSMALAWDYAIKTNNFLLKEIVENRTIDFYLGEQDCKIDTELNDDQFFLSCLIEANLMASVVPAEIFIAWIDRFLPGFKDGNLNSLGDPATLNDNSDKNQLQIDALNLSKAWCLFNISTTLGSDPVLAKSAKNHLNITMTNLSGSELAVEPWLATFAVYAIYSSIHKLPAFNLGY